MVLIKWQHIFNKFIMEGCPAGDAGPVLNTGGGLMPQGFDYAILPPYRPRLADCALTILHKFRSVRIKAITPVL